jgi:hypothetical protein
MAVIGGIIAIAIFGLMTIILNQSHLETTTREEKLNLSGHYEGNINIVGTELGIKVDFSDGGATIDIPAQNVRGLALGNFSFDDPNIHFEITQSAAVFDGEVNGETISGQFMQGGANGTFTLVKKVVLPKEPVPYNEENVTFQNGEITLAGTLTTPNGSGPFTAILLISGSGAQDRNEEVFGFKVFEVMADNFTRDGFAVLRYDDRSIGGSSPGTPNDTTLTFAGDAQAGVEFLRSRLEMNKVGALGHSEGGMIAPMLNDVDFVILMSGPAVPGKEIMLAQSELVLGAENATEEEILANQAIQNAAFEAARTGTGWESVESMIMQALQEKISNMTKEQKAPLGNISQYIDTVVAQQTGAFKSAWIRFFIDYDPAPALEKLRIPVLALLGGLDIQVPIELNQLVMEKALENNTDASIVVFPKANHLYQEAVTGGVSEYATLPKQFVPGFLEAITDWIHERF